MMLLMTSEQIETYLQKECCYVIRQITPLTHRDDWLYYLGRIEGLFHLFNVRNQPAGIKELFDDMLDYFGDN
jgi:hypothetical protein